MANKEFSQAGARQPSTLPQHPFYILSLSSPPLLSLAQLFLKS